MSHILAWAIVIAVATLTLYAVGAFVIFDPNPANWPSALRAILASAWAVFFCLLAGGAVELGR